MSSPAVRRRCVPKFASTGRRIASAAAVAALLAAPAVAQEPAAGADVMIVLDASNSMWGQIDGIAKIEIARQVVGELVRGWDPDRSLGLVAYGHRREGDCTDIETLIPVGPVDAEAFTAAVDGLVPRGKTPLTEAVREAAEALSYADRPATVILVSDGIETCDADPCALGAELERRGVAFTAHVVGFDVAAPEEQAQLQCLAENTGGMFLAAADAAELTDALETVAKPEAAPQPDPAAPARLTLEAVEGSESGPAITDGVDWSVFDPGTERGLSVPEGEARPTLDVKPGTWTVRAERGGDAAVATVEVAPGEERTVRVVLPAARPAASLSIEPEAPTISQEISVTWDGPGADGDYVTVVEPGAAEGTYRDYAYTREGNPLTLALPDRAGTWEIRYVQGDGGATLGALQVIVADVPVALDAPEQAAAGDTVTVAWEGPDGGGDYVTVVEPEADEGAYRDYAYTRDGNPLDIRLPEDAGDFELRYVSGRSGRTLAARPISVRAVEARLEAPASAPAGSRVEVAWKGPDNDGDYVTVVEAGAAEGTYRDYAYTRAGNPVEITLPDDAGPHELRYVTGAEDRTLARAPIAVEAVDAALEAPSTVGAGGLVRVDWTGPDNDGDYVTVVEAGAPEGSYRDYAYTREGTPVEIRVPDASGAYELRYVTGGSDRTLASVPLTVEAASATLEAPPVVKAGQPFPVGWTGPDNPGDYITIVEAGAPEGSYADYAYTRDGTPVEIAAPDAPGAYEVRYVSGGGDSTVERVAVEVR